jgi:hypothetical protein
MRSAWLALPSIALAVACGGSGSDDAADASSDGAVLDDAGADAFVIPPDQDPNVFPAKHHPLPIVSDEKGARLYTPELATVTFTNDPMMTDIWNFGDVVAQGDWWNSVAVPYAFSPAMNTGGWELPDTVSGKTLDDVNDLQPLIQSAIDAAKLPKPTNESLFVFYFPATTTIVNRNGDHTCTNGVGGYHDVMTYRSPGAPDQSLAYAVIARCTSSLDDLTYAASHEIVEAATDPHPSTDPAFYMIGYYPWTGPGGGEVADVCLGRGPSTATGYTMARSWVNAAAKASHDPCQPATPGAIYFQTAIDTEMGAVTDSWGTYRSDGFINITHGTTRQITGTTFSEAALPNDLTLVVGTPITASDPSMVGSIGAGITASISPTTANNGKTVVLTITVDASVKTGDFFFVVRSILSPTDYHSWPVVLRVH